MKHFGILLWAALLLPCVALCEGVTLRTYTPFADMDPGAQGWEEILQRWSTQTGNTADDYSGAQDETWFSELNTALDAGEADLVIVPVGSGLTAGKLTTADELAAAGAQGVRSLADMQEQDGTILLTPVRLGYETLFVNTDVLAQAGLAAPQSWEDLVVDCAVLAQMGVTPVANSLTEWPETVLDCAALIAAPAESYGSEDSLNGAASVLESLVAVGAFGTDPWNATDEACSNAFLTGQAAMRFDSWDFAQNVSAERADSVSAVPLFGMDGSVRSALPGAGRLGLTVSRAALADTSKREAVLSLVSAILSAEGTAGLMTGADGTLADAMAQLNLSCTGLCGVLYDVNPDTFDDWAEKTVSGLMTE